MPWHGNEGSDGRSVQSVHKAKAYVGRAKPMHCSLRRHDW